MICGFIGCDRHTSRSAFYCEAHTKQLRRRGSPNMLTPIGIPIEDVRPCRKCGGRNFSLTSRQCTGRLSRYCLDCHRRRQRLWRALNRKKTLEIRRRYRERHLDECRAAARAWHKAHPEYRRAYEAVARARRRAKRHTEPHVAPSAA